MAADFAIDHEFNQTGFGAVALETLLNWYLLRITIVMRLHTASRHFSRSRQLVTLADSHRSSVTLAPLARVCADVVTLSHRRIMARRVALRRAGGSIRLA